MLDLVVGFEAGLPHQLVVQRRPHWNSRSRGLPRSAFWSSSIASPSRFFGFFGAEIRTRARTSPRPEPPSFGAPRPRIRRSFPSSEPAGTFSDTGPSGVGTSTFAPRAASAYVTGTFTTRSAPRRSYNGEGSTRVTTKRSPGGPPPD